MKLIINSKHFNDVSVKHYKIDLINQVFFCISLYFLLYCLLLFMFLFNFWGIKNDRYIASILICWTLSFCPFLEFILPLMSQLQFIEETFCPGLSCATADIPSFLSCLTKGDLTLTNLIAVYFISYLGAFLTDWGYLQISYQFVTRRKDNKIVNA